MGKQAAVADNESSERKVRRVGITLASMIGAFVVLVALLLLVLFVL